MQMISPELNYMDISLLVLIIGLWLHHIFVQRKIQKKIAEVEKKHLSLTNYNNSLTNKVVHLEKACAWLQKTLEKNMRTLAKKMNEVGKNSGMLSDQRDEIMWEVDSRVEPLRASLNDTLDQMKNVQDSMKKMVRENGKDSERLAKELNDFSEEIRKMKNCIRERTIDLEL